MQQVNPFELTTIEFEQWLTEQDRKQQEILSLLNHCQYKGTVIPSQWRVDSHSFYIVSQSAKRRTWYS